MPIIKKREIENLEQLSGEELEAFIKRLPAAPDYFEDMFGFIEDKLDDETCNHTLRFAMQYIMQNRLNFPKMSAWLNENGGFCDCKVLEEIVPVWRNAFDN